MDAGRREDGVVGVADDRVCGVGVERSPLFVQPLELVVVLCERTVAAANALPARLDVDVEPERRRAVGEQLARRRGGDGTAAEHDDRAGTAEQCFGHRRFLDDAKRRLAVLVEVVGNRPDQALEIRVDVGQRRTDARGELPAERRLTRPHEADEREVFPVHRSHALVSDTAGKP